MDLLRWSIGVGIGVVLLCAITENKDFHFSLSMICSSVNVHLGRVLDFLTRSSPTSAFPTALLILVSKLLFQSHLLLKKETQQKTCNCMFLVSGYFLLSQLLLSSLVAACWWSGCESGNHMTSRETTSGSGRLTSSGAWRSWLAPVCFCLPALLLLALLSPRQILSLLLFPPPSCLLFLLRVSPLFARAVSTIHHTAAAPIVKTPRRPSLRPCVSRGC